jgi:DKNYY family
VADNQDNHFSGIFQITLWTFGNLWQISNFASANREHAAEIDRGGAHPGIGDPAVYSADGQVLSDDPAHFVVIFNTSAYLYTKDSHTVAVNHAPIAGANPASFQVIREPYARDDRHLFYFTDEISGADTASFQVLDGARMRKTPGAPTARHSPSPR